MPFATLCAVLIALPQPSTAKDKDPFKTVETVMAKYRQAPAIKSKIEKRVVNEFTGTDQTSKGEFYFSKGKLRLDFSEPEKSVLVYDGKYIWLESHLDENTVQVAKMKTNDLKRSKSVLTALFEKKEILRGFKLAKSKTEGDLKTFTFEPKDQKADNELAQLSIGLKGKSLVRVSYRDNMENDVSFEFLDLTRGEVPAAKFSYSPPKNAEVTEI